MVSPEKAIDILHMEARDGLLDTELVETMVATTVSTTGEAAPMPRS